MPCKTFLVKIVNPSTQDFYTRKYNHKGDAGLDLFIPEDIVILPGETKLIDCGVQCRSRSFNWSILKWFKGDFYNYHSYFLVPRSSIYKTPLVLRNSIGIIDSEYTGNLKAPLQNISHENFTLHKGQRFLQVVNSDLQNARYKLVDELKKTERGSNGFGSSGK